MLKAWEALERLMRRLFKRKGADPHALPAPL